MLKIQHTAAAAQTEDRQGLSLSRFLLAKGFRNNKSHPLYWETIICLKTNPTRPKQFIKRFLVDFTSYDFFCLFFLPLEAKLEMQTVWKQHWTRVYRVYTHLPKLNNLLKLFFLLISLSDSGHFDLSLLKKELCFVASSLVIPVCTIPGPRNP